MLASSRSALFAVSAAVLFAAAPAASLIIDDFEVGDFMLTDDTTTTGASFIENGGLPAGVLGGTRLVRQRVTTTNALLPAISTATLNTTAADDAVAITSLVGLDLNIQTIFAYDGVADGNVGGKSGTLGLNLSNYNFFRIIAAAPNVDANVVVTMWTSATGRTGGLIPLVDGVIDIPLIAFNLDLTDIQAIQVMINGQNEGEVVNLSEFSFVVPEPTTGLLLVSGLVGLAIRRRP